MGEALRLLAIGRAMATVVSHGDGCRAHRCATGPFMPWPPRPGPGAARKES